MYFEPKSKIMAWIVRNKDEVLLISNNKPERINHRYWGFNVETVMNDEYADTTFIKLPSDADELLIGRHITWEDEPVEIKDE